MSNWPVSKLGTLTSKIGSGATPRGGGATYVQSGVAFIRSQNILDHEMKLEGIAHINDDAADKLRGVTVESNDVLINITGDSIARCSVVSPTILPARVNQHVAILRTTSQLDPRFLQKFLVEPTFKDHLIGISSGGTRKALTRSDLSNLDIPVPPLEVQQAIAEVLGSLDDKIAANVRLAKTLAAMATAQFDLCVKLGQHSVPLNELVTTQYGVTTSSHEGPGPKFLRVTDINKKPWIEWATTPFCTVSESELAKYKVNAGDILVARMADPGKAAFVDQNDPEAVFASYLVRLRTIDIRQALFIYYFLRSDTYRNYAAGAMQGSVQKNMNAKVIVATNISIPGPEILSQFNGTVSKLRAQIQTVLKENVKLTETRDELIPKLMSGKLRVGDAEKVFSATT